MKSAALEAVLSEFSTLVVPAARLERPRVPTVPCGIVSVDELTGGLPRGCLTEICGPASSGRTTLLMAALADATARGEVCALVDASDSFDPLSAQQAGVDLERVLWVRCQQSAVITQHSGEHSASGIRHPEQPATSKQQSEETGRRKDKETRFINSGMKNCGSRGVHTQLYSGMPELPEINVLTRPEQRYRDIDKLKQGDYSEPGKPIPPQRHSDTAQHPAYGIRHSEPSAFNTQQSAKPNHGFPRIATDTNLEINNVTLRRGSTINADFQSKIKNQKSKMNAELSRVEQALKVTDLLLQSGGFGLIALDLGDVSTRNARRVPLTSWFRFRRAVENTATVLLVLEREAHARSCASLVVELAQQSAFSSQHSAKRIPPQSHRDTDETREKAPRRGSTRIDAGFKSEIGNQNSEIEEQHSAFSSQHSEQLTLVDIPFGEGMPSHAELLTGITSQVEVARGERKPVGSVRAEFTSRSAWGA